MSRHVTTATQCRNLDRHMQALRRNMERVALGKDPGALADALKDIEAIRQQLPVIERLARELGSVPVEQLKPSIRPVDRLPVGLPVRSNESPPSSAGLD